MSPPVCGLNAGVNSGTFVDFFKGGGDWRCNVRVLFVSSLFLLFLSFCAIMAFLILYVFSSFSL